MTLSDGCWHCGAPVTVRHLDEWLDDSHSAHITATETKHIMADHMGTHFCQEHQRWEYFVTTEKQRNHTI